MNASLSALDLGVVVAYLAAVFALSSIAASRQRSAEDYFLAGRSMRGWVLALSIVANQTSAVSLIGIPAFVALQTGGGLRWLQYEVALPLSMLAVAAVLLGPLRRVPGSSIYSFIERRFGVTARRLLALAFILSRGLSLGVLLYASALVTSESFGWPVDVAILTVGLFAVAYTSLGGIVADIWSDVLQLVILWTGVAAASVYLLVTHGLSLLRAVPPSRLEAIVVRGPALGPESTFTLWPMLLGGLFLYASYYGCDQSQAQRLLAARSDDDARRALVLNGLLRFPLVLSYSLLGLLLAGLLQVDAVFAARIAGRANDSLVPAFMVSYLPVGLRGLFLAAIFAAAMSSIDSALNSLSAVTMEDVLGRPHWARGVWAARLTSLVWGLFAVAAGLVFARSSRGVLELVNQVGSLVYGPVLAVFVLGATTRVVSGRAVLAGFFGGIAANAGVSVLAPSVSWMWWNLSGFVAAAGVAVVLSRDARFSLPGAWPRREARILVAAFVVMLAALLLV